MKITKYNLSPPPRQPLAPMAKVPYTPKSSHKSMRNHKSILYLLAPALFLGASCTNIATNANETVSNENTNTTDTSGEVDTSDPALSEVEGWLAYTNEEYGFSFRYPSDWIITEQENKLAKNEQIRIRFSPSDYQPEGSYGDMLYNPYLVTVSYYNVPFKYYGSLLLNEIEEDLVIDGIVVKKVVGQVYNNGPEEIMVYMPDSSNDQHLRAVLNVVEGEYVKVFDKVIFSTRWLF